MDELFPTIALEKGRGCGERDPEMPYLCHGLALVGQPVEYFMFDPFIAWDDVWQRGYFLVENSGGVTDVYMWISPDHYPTPYDFVAEVKAGGVSRKVDKSFPFHKLTPGVSQMRFIHKNAIPLFNFEMRGPASANDPAHCRLHHCKWQVPDWMARDFPAIDPVFPGTAWPVLGVKTGYHPSDGDTCSYANQTLSYLVHKEQTTEGYELSHLPETDLFTVYGPSFSYSAFMPTLGERHEFDHTALMPPWYKKDIMWRPGLFYWTTIEHVEYFAQADEQSQEAAEMAGYQTVVLPW